MRNIKGIVIKIPADRWVLFEGLIQLSCYLIIFLKEPIVEGISIKLDQKW